MTLGRSENPPTERRAVTLGEFQQLAQRIFRARPEIRSAIFAIDNWVDDFAVEDVASHIVISPRDVPVWPHPCGTALSAGDFCGRCGEHPFEPIHIASVEAFLPYCWPNVPHPWERIPIPYAIARRGADGEPLIEVIGKIRRRYPEVIAGAHDVQPWLALPRAAALYELVAANPADDAPRRVLADYLLEQDHPRGELIALDLAGELDATGSARRDHLLARYARAWISPLDIAIPEGGERWERGFLAGATVSVAGNAERLRGAAAWRTVETIRFIGDEDVIDLEMTALRDVGPVGRRGLRALAAAPRPWAIERLIARVDFHENDVVDELWSATTLPRLAHLVLCGHGPDLDETLELPRPAWWPQLARLTLWANPVAVAPLLVAHGDAAPRVAVAAFHARTRELGWELVMRPQLLEVSLAGWSEDAQRGALHEMLAEFPQELAIELVPSAYWAPTHEDAARLAEATRRAVQVRS